MATPTHPARRHSRVSRRARSPQARLLPAIVALACVTAPFVVVVETYAGAI